MTMPEYSRDACNTCGDWAEWFCDDENKFCLFHAPAEADGWLHKIGLSRPKSKPKPKKAKPIEQPQEPWMRQAWAVLNDYLRRNDRFFVDEFWLEPKLDRSIGVAGMSKLVERAFNEGLIRQSGERRLSAINSNVEKPVWTSMVYQGVLA